MSKKKQQWLINAEKELKKFNDSKLGKMTQEEWEFFERQYNAGKISGDKHKASGHWDKVRKAQEEWAKNNPEQVKANAKNARAHSPMGQINKERGWMHEIANFETRSKGGKKSYQNHVESGWIHEYRRLGTEASAKSRKKAKNDKIQKIIDLLPKDSEFIGTVIKEACIKLGERPLYYKTVLQSDFIEKTYHGKNQHDPSRYKRAI